MSDPFIGEIKIIPWNFPPKGWAFCNGQLLPINQNQPLFSILGTTYGGNGQTNFALPDLRGREPIHTGAGFTLGERAGAEAVTINSQTAPTHIHFTNASTAAGNTVTPQGGFFAAANNVYTGPNSLQALNAAQLTSIGGSQPHLNLQPFLVLNFIIALQGIFPSQN